MSLMIKTCKRNTRVFLIPSILLLTFIFLILPDQTLAKEISWPKVPEIYSDSCVLLDADTGEVLYGVNEHELRYPASITKICTALVILENHDWNDKLTCEGEGLMKLPEGYVSFEPVKGERIPVKDVLYALLMRSANDAGNCLAVYDAGSIADFADRMNERAKQAGALDTHFTNPSGLFEEEHQTTAYDMAMIMKDCIRLDQFNQIASDRAYTIKKTKKHAARPIETHVLPLIKESYYYIPEVIAGKTGFTTPSRYTMVTAARKNGRTLVCCVLNCASEDARCITSKRLYDYGFAYKNVTITAEALSLLNFQTEDPALKNMMSNPCFREELITADSFKIPYNAELSDLDIKIESYETLEPDKDQEAAPVLVTLAFCHGGEKLGQAQLTYAPVNQLDMTPDNELAKIFTPFRLAWGGLLILILLVIIIRSTDWRRLFGKKDKAAEAEPPAGQTGAEPEADMVQAEANQDTDKVQDPDSGKDVLVVAEELVAAIQAVPASVIRAKDHPDAEGQEDSGSITEEELESTGETRDHILEDVKKLVDQDADKTDDNGSGQEPVTSELVQSVLSEHKR